MPHSSARTPRPRGRLATDIAEELSLQIRNGTLEAGTRLSTEQRLCERFGVSRAVVREAISRMKSEGLVRSRQGSGVYVTDATTRRSFRLGEDLVDTAEVFALLELRQPVEVESARLAAQRVTPASLALIVGAHEAMIQSSDWSEDGVTADLEFHHAIAQATGNAYYANFMAFLGNALRTMIRTARVKSGKEQIKDITVAEHGRILDAIRQGDPAAAALAMAEHIAGAGSRTSSDDGPRPALPALAREDTGPTERTAEGSG